MVFGFHSVLLKISSGVTLLNVDLQCQTGWLPGRICFGWFGVLDSAVLPTSCSRIITPTNQSAVISVKM